VKQTKNVEYARLIHMDMTVLRSRLDRTRSERRERVCGDRKGEGGRRGKEGRRGQEGNKKRGGDKRRHDRPRVGDCEVRGSGAVEQGTGLQRRLAREDH
jgi:hypothetical protein